MSPETTEKRWEPVPWLKDWVVIERDTERLETAAQAADYLNALEDRATAAELDKAAWMKKADELWADLEAARAELALPN
jgi:hypothetical protein